MFIVLAILIITLVVIMVVPIISFFKGGTKSSHSSSDEDTFDDIPQCVERPAIVIDKEAAMIPQSSIYNPPHTDLYELTCQV